METHLSHTTTPESQKTTNLFFDDPLFEDFAVRALSLDGCPLGEVSATTSRIEEGDRDGWYEQLTASQHSAMRVLERVTRSAPAMPTLGRLATTALPTYPCTVHRSMLG